MGSSSTHCNSRYQVFCCTCTSISLRIRSRSWGANLVFWKTIVFCQHVVILRKMQSPRKETQSKKNAIHHTHVGLHRRFPLKSLTVIIARWRGRWRKLRNTSGREVQGDIETFVCALQIVILHSGIEFIQPDIPTVYRSNVCTTAAGRIPKVPMKTSSRRSNNNMMGT